MSACDRLKFSIWRRRVIYMSEHVSSSGTSEDLDQTHQQVRVKRHSSDIEIE